MMKNLAEIILFWLVKIKHFIMSTNEENTTIFASYYDTNGKLQKVTMSEISDLISDQDNKAVVADWVYHRLYDRFLKPFFFDDDSELKKHQELVELYQKQYKHGFAIMTNCCLLIETLAAFLNGDNETSKDKGSAVKAYTKVFKKAQGYNNCLKTFKDKPLYGAVRCGLLHQGETYNSFIIRRSGNILHNDGKTINASLFAKALKKFLESYRDELKSDECKWDSELWDNCRKKIRHIIANSSKK